MGRAAQERQSEENVLRRSSHSCTALWFVCVYTAPTPQGRSPGSLAWAGLANTFFWIDPARRVTGVFMTQLLPFFDKAMALFRAYEAAVYQAL